MILITEDSDTDFIPLLKKVYTDAYYEYIRKNTLNR